MSYKRDNLEEYNNSTAAEFAEKALATYTEIQVKDLKDLKITPDQWYYIGEKDLTKYILQTFTKEGHQLEYVTVSEVKVKDGEPTQITLRNVYKLVKKGPKDDFPEVEYKFVPNTDAQTLKGPALKTDYTFYERNDSKKAGGKRRNRTRRTRRRTQNRKTKRSRRSA